MLVWEKIQTAIDDARRQTLGAVLDAFAKQKMRRDETAFSIALIALSAKMAKADGLVTTDEIDAFRRFFTYPDAEADKISMIYRLAQQDVAGFDHYLAQVAKIFEAAPKVLEDVLDCLFYIAGADGVEHPREMALLEGAAKAFKTPASTFRRLRAIHLGLDADDPYAILGVEPGTSAKDLRAAYRTLVREHHPDALMARGVPGNLVKIGEARTAAINAAYEALRRDGA